MNEQEIKDLRILTGKMLKQYAAKKIDYESFMNALPQEDLDKSVSTAIHMVGHFDDDKNLCAKDKDYEELLTKELLEMADILEKGEAFPKIEHIKSWDAFVIWFRREFKL
ncbi:MAG: hypothetical protein H0W44_00150 [Gammaproteobacteria bacterium]|nr:hypothetical protein [Gammaproteobacteria bacterium]